MGAAHTINLQLEIIPGNKVLVPGCEPTSSISSTTLSAYLAKKSCGNALVDVSIALTAIPGSHVKTGSNFNRGANVQKWFVLPSISTSCPCDEHLDYYAILKGLADTEIPLTEEACNVNDMGYCPHPDFKLAEPPPKDPFIPEGSFPGEGGRLPPIPNWRDVS